jgi:hypothetical protein
MNLTTSLSLAPFAHAEPINLEIRDREMGYGLERSEVLRSTGGSAPPKSLHLFLEGLKGTEIGS